MYSHSDALKIFKYYIDKLVGKPLDKSQSESLLIDHLKIDELDNGKFRVICIGVASASVHLFRDIHSVAKDLGLSLPHEIVEQQK